MRRDVVVGLALAAMASLLWRSESSASIEAPRKEPSSQRPAPPLRGDLRFVENAGQMTESVAFAAVGRDRTALLGARALTFVVSHGDRRASVEFAFDDARTVRPRGELPTRVVQHYFRGETGAARPAHARTFSGVAYDGLWPGIDLRFDTRPAGIEYSLVVRPGADARAARFRVVGADRVEKTADGQLCADTPAGPLAQSRPVAWQERDGGRTPVEVAFEVGPRGDDGTSTYGFALGAHDASRAVVIDPEFEVESFPSGLAEGDQIHAMSLRSDGDYYAVGRTSWPDVIPEDKGGFDAKFAGSFDAWVGRFDPTGALRWAAFLGGRGDVTNGFGDRDDTSDVGVDADGGVVVVGDTNSADFPVKIGPSVGATTNGINSNAWIARISADGATLVHSGILGGWRPHLAVAADGAACVAWSTNHFWPITATPTTTIGNPGGGSFLWMAKVSRAGGFEYLTELRGDISGTQHDANSVAVAPDGGVCVTGYTNGGALPPAPVVNSYRGGESDAFVLKLDAAGSSLAYALYLGGSQGDFGGGIAVDAAGAAYVCGYTVSDIVTFPRWSENGGSINGFLLKVPPSGGPAEFVLGLQSSFFPGPINAWQQYGVALDTAGGVWASDAGKLVRFDQSGNPLGDYGWIYCHGRPAVRSPRELWFADHTVCRARDVSAATPTGLTAIAQSAHTVRVWWTPETHDATSYEIERSVDGTFTVVTTTTADSPFFTDAGLQPDTEYLYAVRAVTAESWSRTTEPIAVRTLPTFDLRLRRGSAWQVISGTLRLRGSVKFLRGSTDGTFDPATDALRLELGGVLVLDVSAGDAGWTKARTTRTFRRTTSPTQTTTLHLDFDRHTFSFVGTGFDLNDVAIGRNRTVLRVGDDAGSAVVDWRRIGRRKFGVR